MHSGSSFTADRQNAQFPGKTRGTVFCFWYDFLMENRQKWCISEKNKTTIVSHKQLSLFYLVEVMGFSCVYGGETGIRTHHVAAVSNDAKRSWHL
jgi:hypothetical protein